MDLQTYLRINGCTNCRFDTRQHHQGGLFNKDQQSNKNNGCSHLELCLKQAELGQSYAHEESNLAKACYKEGFDKGRKAGIKEVKTALEENLFGGKKLD